MKEIVVAISWFLMTVVLGGNAQTANGVQDRPEFPLPEFNN